MISNNIALLSQNVKTINPIKNNKNDYITNPRKLLKISMQARIKRSHENLFNFINDTIL